MNRLRWVKAALAACLALAPVAANAATSSGTHYYLAKVVQVQPVSSANPQGILKVRPEGGPKTGQVTQLPSTGLYSASDITLPTYSVGQIVVISATSVAGQQPQYAVIDHWRLPAGAMLFGIVIVLAVVVAGWRGIGSFAGLVVSIAVIGAYILPGILHGGSAQLIATTGCFIIAAATIFLAHGFSRRTVIALAAVYLTLLVALVLSDVAMSLFTLNGVATEDASYLAQQMPSLNIQGVLLAGIMVGVLGVLDDITVGQATAIDELRRANDKLPWRDLYGRGIRVGREHIASLINTLVLAYAGSTFVFVAYVVAVSNLPLWLTINSELVMEELARALVGSMALILAVPIATGLSAYFLTHSLAGDRDRKHGRRGRKAA